MASIIREIALAAPAAFVWDALRDLGGVHRRLARGFVLHTELDGAERIVTFQGGLSVRERIVSLDEGRRRLAYTAAGGRARHHHASFEVRALDEERSQLLWVTDLLPDEAAPALTEMVDRGVEAIRRTLEEDHAARGGRSAPAADRSAAPLDGAPSPEHGEGRRAPTFPAELLANGPHPELAPELALYGQFVGSWDQEVTCVERDGTERSARGEWHFGWILGGRAIGDVWMVPTRAELDRGAPLLGYGLTVRIPDRKTGAWKISWSGVLKDVALQLTGSQVGDEIVQEGTDADGALVRWIFSDVRADAFRWREELSEDGGRSWQVRQRFLARRRPQR